MSLWYGKWNFFEANVKWRKRSDRPRCLLARRDKGNLSVWQRWWVLKSELDTWQHSGPTLSRWDNSQSGTTGNAAPIFSLRVGPTNQICCIRHTDLCEASYGALVQKVYRCSVFVTRCDCAVKALNIQLLPLPWRSQPFPVSIGTKQEVSACQIASEASDSKGWEKEPLALASKASWC